MANSSLRVRTKLIHVVSEDASGFDTSFRRDEGTYVDQTRTDLAENSSGTFLLAASASNTALPLGSVATAKAIYLEFDGQITIKVNGGTETLTLDPVSSGRGKFFWEGTLTAITASNPSSTAAVTIHYSFTGAA